MMSQNEIEILKCFFPQLDPLASKDVEDKSGFSHETIFRLLKALVNKGCLTKRKVGKTNVYEIVKDRDILYQPFVSYMTEKRLGFKKKHLLMYKRLYAFLNEINPEGPAIIFGSFAKGTQTGNSDIDLLCVDNTKNIQEVSRTFKTKYGINIQPAVVKTSDFKNIKKDNPVFWNDLIIFGIVLDGLDIFIRVAYLND